MTTSRFLRASILVGCAAAVACAPGSRVPPTTPAATYPSPTGAVPNPATATPTAALSPVERAIATAVDARSAEGLALLERIVNINSGTMNFRGVRQVGDVLRAQLDSLGFETRWVDGTPFGRAGHLFAERSGSGPRLLLIGHLDTVFELTSPFQRFERLSDTTARGPGIIDMKGGDVIIIQAFKALRAAGVLDSMSITVYFGGDEESAGRPIPLARAALIEAAQRSQYAIGFEDGSGDPRTAVIARRSSGSWVLTSTGKPAHSSQIFRSDVGAGAIFESARVLQQFREQLAGQQFLTFNPATALGGTDVSVDSAQSGGSAFGKENVVPKAMRVTGDLRALTPGQIESVKTAMRSIAAASLSNTTSRIVFDDRYPPLAPTDGNRRLLATYDQVSRDLGYWPVVAVDPMRAGAADVSFVAPFIPSAMDAIGLAGWDDHTDRETADLRMLAPLTKRAAVFLYRLSGATAR